MNSSNMYNSEQNPSLVSVHVRVNACTAARRFISVPRYAHSLAEVLGGKASLPQELVQTACIPTVSGPSSLDSVKHIHSILQHVSSLPKCELSEECCASSELSGGDSPAQLRPSCSAMSTIFWSALSVLLREPGGEEGGTGSAVQGPALGWGGERGAGCRGLAAP